MMPYSVGRSTAKYADRPQKAIPGESSRPILSMATLALLFSSSTRQLLKLKLILKLTRKARRPFGATLVVCWLTAGRVNIVPSCDGDYMLVLRC
jgi:hypothetical protein